MIRPTRRKERDMKHKDPNDLTLREPSSRETFFFDAGRSYQTGVLGAVMGGDKVSWKDFPYICRAILIRYLKQPEDINELYKAYLEGYAKGKDCRDDLGAAFLKTKGEA